MFYILPFIIFICGRILMKKWGVTTKKLSKSTVSWIFLKSQTPCSSLSFYHKMKRKKLDLDRCRKTVFEMFKCKPLPELWSKQISWNTVFTIESLRKWFAGHFQHSGGLLEMVNLQQSPSLICALQNGTKIINLVWCGSPAPLISL